MSSVQEPPLAFDDLAIDFVGRRLTRGGLALALEPKAFDVLALLARSPGTAFTRDQILDAVWGHRHVTPGVLNRVMTMLRHALGEDAQSPRYLRTLHGVGYRFDLPPAAAPVVEADIVADLAVPPRLPRRRWRLAALVAAGLVIALGLWLARGREIDPAPARVATAVPTLIVMPLRPIGADGGAADIAAGLSEELIGTLSRIAGLRVIARESTSLAAAAGGAGAGLDRRLGITHALEGSLRQSGESLRVSIRLTEMANGRTLWAQDFDRRAEDVLALQRDIAQAVATALTLRLALAPTPRGGDAQFLQRYFAARALVGLRTRIAPEQVERGEVEFRELVFQRPDDARTHAGLAMALEARAFQHPPLAGALRQEAAREADRALRLDPAQADALGVQAAAACRAERWEDCVSGSERAIAIAPSDSALRFQQAMALASMGYLARAEAIVRAGRQRDPLSAVWPFALARLLDTQGRHDEAYATYGTRTMSSSPYGPWYNAVWRGDLGAAATIADAIDQSAYDDAVSLEPAYAATTAALRDPRRWPAAVAAMEAWEAQSGHMNFLRVLVPGADPAPLLADLATTRRRSYSTWDLLVWTRDTAFLREGPAFQRYLADSGIGAYWRRHGYPPQCAPRGEVVACR
jgi:TolB-like protein/DNA-binding winged helix-turn-helix (wHTH) protein